MAENIRQDSDKNKQGFDRQYDKGKTGQTAGQTDKRPTGNVERREDRQGSGGMGRNDYPSKEIGRTEDQDTEIGGRGMDKDVDKDLDLNKDSDFESRGAA